MDVELDVGEIKTSEKPFEVLSVYRFMPM